MKYNSELNEVAFFFMCIGLSHFKREEVNKWRTLRGERKEAKQEVDEEHEIKLSSDACSDKLSRKSSSDVVFEQQSCSHSNKATHFSAPHAFYLLSVV